MKKSKILEEVGFDFSWDPKKVWKLNEPVVEMDINELLWLFDIPFWDKEGTDEWNLTPWDVIRYPDLYRNHSDLVKEADISHPIDLMENKGRWLTLDGLHRLAKLHTQGEKTVRARIIPRSRIPEILKG